MYHNLFQIEKECERKTCLILHDFYRIICDIRKKKNRARKVCLQKKFLPVLGTRKVETYSGFLHYICIYNNDSDEMYIICPRRIRVFRSATARICANLPKDATKPQMCF